MLANGARHLLNSPLVLGTCVDAEADGSPVTAGMTDENPNPGTDDLINGIVSPFLPPTPTCSNQDDEDGLVGINDGDWSDGEGSLDVSVSGVDTGVGACVYAWIDFNQNGFDAGDATAQMSYAADGTQTIVFNTNVPASGSFPAGVPIYMRLRVVPGSCGTLAPVGEVTGGEVEDHDINSSSPTAIGLGDVTATLPVADRVWILVSVLSLLFVSSIVMIRRRDDGMIA